MDLVPTKSQEDKGSGQIQKRDDRESPNILPKTLEVE